MAIKNDFEDLADTLGDLGGLLIKRAVRAFQNMEASVSDGFPPEKATAHDHVDGTDRNDRRSNLQRQAMAVVGRSFMLPKFPGSGAPSWGGQGAHDQCRQPGCAGYGHWGGSKRHPDGCTDA